MTNHENLEEPNMTICFKNSKKDEVSSLSGNMTLPSINEKFLYETESNRSSKLKFKSGFASECFEKIVRHDDLHHARQNSRKRQEKGAIIKGRLSKFANLTTRNLVKSSTTRLGKDILDLMVERRSEKKRLE